MFSVYMIDFVLSCVCDSLFALGILVLSEYKNSTTDSPLSQRIRLV